MPNPMTGAGGAYNALDQIVAQRMQQEAIKRQMAQQEIENQQRQQQLDLQAEGAKFSREDLAWRNRQAMGNQLVDELSPGASLDPGTAGILRSSGRGGLVQENAPYAFPGFLRSTGVRDVIPGEQAGSVFTGTAGQRFQREQAGLLADERAADNARAAAAAAETGRHNIATEKAAQEPIVQIMGPNGTPVWAPRSQAIGQPAAQAPRAVTGQERQTLSYYNRAKRASEDIAPLEDQIAKSGLGRQFQLQYAPNIAQTPQQQSYRQAQRAFTEARLRKESGAAIPTPEYENDARTYFAQPGDSPETVEQKRQARGVVLEGLRFSSGKAYDEFYGEAGPGAKRQGGGPAIGTRRTINGQSAMWDGQGWLPAP